LPKISYISFNYEEERKTTKNELQMKKMHENKWPCNCKRALVRPTYLNRCSGSLETCLSK